ncbi:YicC/YloC family endoribonuclease [Eubacterium sp.]|uniref:YicC/YloC family endoribonuclease n=1 Tax=Eubacterium sp. TaxID=142586 RepID=UPI00258C8373|nr:YicC/YloC family endoribonuclease [Eubacterium sp.]MCR5369042.1 YicC family protein [Eubacterium sp.]
MIKSMTGFGRYEAQSPERKITVEIKSVNHRYCEMTIKMPKKLNFFEASIRNLLKNYISRGKVDVYISYEDYVLGKSCVKYNEDIAKEYLELIRKMGESFGIESDIKAASLARFPEIFTIEEQSIDTDELWEIIEHAISAAAEQFVESRVSEGEHLKNDLIGKLDGMVKAIDLIEERSPQVVDEYRERITNKVEELLSDTQIDQAILATEITLFADKICVDEETVRLRAHIDHMRKTLSEADNIGRKLDFIAQEMNREANTILSKASDLLITNTAIDLKTEIEKIREQIQNIE